MIGNIKYRKGQTFRDPTARRARALYAADLRDLGFTYSAIAEALGLPAHTKERARRIVNLGYGYRDEDGAIPEPCPHEIYDVDVQSDSLGTLVSCSHCGAALEFYAHEPISNEGLPATNEDGLTYRVQSPGPQDRERLEREHREYMEYLGVEDSSENPRES